MHVVLVMLFHDNMCHPEWVLCDAGWNACLDVHCTSPDSLVPPIPAMIELSMYFRGNLTVRLPFEERTKEVFLLKHSGSSFAGISVRSPRKL